MNTTFSTVLLAALSVFMFSLSCFGQSAGLHDLAVIQMHDHELTSDETSEMGEDYARWWEEQVRGPLPEGPQGPGPFLPETQTEDDWLVQNPEVLGAIVVGNPADLPGEHTNNWAGISNGFIWMTAANRRAAGQTSGSRGGSYIDLHAIATLGLVQVNAWEAMVSGLIDIEDYLSKGGENMMDDAVLLAHWQGHRGRLGKENYGSFPLTKGGSKGEVILVIPQDDPRIDPITGLLILPWEKKGYLDREEPLPGNGRRCDEPGR